jgi:NADH dehydrogenase
MKPLQGLVLALGLAIAAPAAAQQPPAPQRTIVIVGGGPAGLAAADEEAIALQAEIRAGLVEVTLVDKVPKATPTWNLPYRATKGAQHVESRPLGAIAKEIGVKFVRGTVENFDPKAHSIDVVTDGKRMPIRYDAVVLAVGAVSNVPGAVDGPKHEHVLPLRSQAEADRIHEELEHKIGLAAHEHDSERRRNMLTFAVAGAGLTGIELAGSLSDRARKLAKKNDINPNEVKVMLMQRGPKILSDASPDSPIHDRDRENARRALVKAGVEVLTDTEVKGFGPNEVTVADRDGTRTIKTGLSVWTGGDKAPDFIAQAEGLEHGRAGRVVVDPDMRARGTEDVYVVGDSAEVLSNARPGAPEGSRYAFHNVLGALDSGKRAAKAIADRLHGREPSENFEPPKNQSWIALIGKKRSAGRVYFGDSSRHNGIAVSGRVGRVLKAGIETMDKATLRAAEVRVELGRAMHPSPAPPRKP